MRDKWIELVGVTFTRFKKGNAAPVDLDQDYPLNSLQGEFGPNDGWPGELVYLDIWGNPTNTPEENDPWIRATCDAWGMSFSFVPNGKLFNADEYGIIHYEVLNAGCVDAFGEWKNDLVKIAEGFLDEAARDIRFGGTPPARVSFLTKWQISISRDYWTGEVDHDYDLISAFEVE